MGNPNALAALMGTPAGQRLRQLQASQQGGVVPQPLFNGGGPNPPLEWYPPLQPLPPGRSGTAPGQATGAVRPANNRPLTNPSETAPFGGPPVKRPSATPQPRPGEFETRRLFQGGFNPPR